MNDILSRTMIECYMIFFMIVLELKTRLFIIIFSLLEITSLDLHPCIFCLVLQYILY